MPSMRQIMDDIDSFIACTRQSMKYKNLAELTLVENSIQTAKELALWLDRCEYIRKQGKKKETTYDKR